MNIESVYTILYAFVVSMKYDLSMACLFKSAKQRKKKIQKEERIMQNRNWEILTCVKSCGFLLIEWRVWSKNAFNLHFIFIRSLFLCLWSNLVDIMEKFDRGDDNDDERDEESDDDQEDVVG